MSDYIIEPARVTDAPAIGLILSEWIDETRWMPRIHSRADEQEFAASLVANNWVTVARRCGALVGFLARDRTEIHALYLTHAARGQGIGTALLTQAKAQQARLTLYTFQDNTGAQSFYLRERFVEIERTNGAGNDEKLPDIRFEWKRDVV